MLFSIIYSTMSVKNKTIIMRAKDFKILHILCTLNIDSTFTKHSLLTMTLIQSYIFYLPISICYQPMKFGLFVDHVITPISYLPITICPVYLVIIDVKIYRQCFLYIFNWYLSHAMIGRQRHPLDIRILREQQERIRDNTYLPIAKKLQAHGARTHRAVRCEQTQVATAAVVDRAGIGSWKKEGKN